MKISASLYSNADMDRQTLVEELDAHHIDAFHIDCNDDPSVFDDIAQIRQWSDTPIDLHIITPTPEKYYPLLEKHPVEYVQFQYEPLQGPLRVPKVPGMKAGLSIVSSTDVAVYEQFADSCEFLLFMTTVPGQSGGTFDKATFQKIREFRRAHPGVPVHVDGGVNAETSFILRTMGVNMVISGSFLVKHDKIGAALLSLRIEETKSHFRLRDFMIAKEHLIVLRENQANLATVLEAIEDGKLGFVMFEDRVGKLVGLSSNADVRKGLLKNMADLNQTPLVDILNPSPTTVEADATIEQLLELIRSKDFIINFLPVVEPDGTLAGALTFHNLIRGES